MTVPRASRHKRPAPSETAHNGDRLGPTVTDRSLASGGGFGYLIERSMKMLVDPVDGVLSRQNKTIDDRSQQFQSRMDSLDKLVAAKRARLERQFANLETVLAGLQSQQSALGSLGTITQPPAASSSSSSSGSAS